MYIRGKRAPITILRQGRKYLLGLTFRGFRKCTYTVSMKAYLGFYTRARSLYPFGRLQRFCKHKLTYNVMYNYAAIGTQPVCMLLVITRKQNANYKNSHHYSLQSVQCVFYFEFMHNIVIFHVSHILVIYIYYTCTCTCTCRQKIINNKQKERAGEQPTWISGGCQSEWQPHR